MVATGKRKRPPSFTARLARAMGGLVVLIVLLVGVPLALLLLGGNPIPASLPTLDQIADLVTSPNRDGTLFLAAIAYLGWLGWASFAISVLLEAVAAIPGRRAPRIRGLRTQQRVAATLIGLVLSVVAGPGTAAVAHTAHDEVTAASSDTAAHAADPASPVLTTMQPPAPYTVHPGDSLWRIAERRLGDGALWPEIAEINYGRSQQGAPRGLDETHVIHPGWVLEIPRADVGPVDDAYHEPHIVAPGDTLWSIAEAHLEPPTSDAEIAAEWPRWYDANREVIGDNPDLILPGQRLAHPDAGPDGAGAPGSDDADSDADEPERGDAPQTAAPEVSGPASPSPPASTAEGGAPASAPEAAPTPLADGFVDPGIGSEDIGSEDTALPVLPDITVTPTPAVDAGIGDGAVSHGVPVRTVGGIGALLAAALTALVAVGRRRQHGKRRRGEEIPVPSERASSTEQELWSIADPVGAQMLDLALRSLAGNVSSLPAVRAARLTAHAVELYLTTPMQLPHPWQSRANATVWSLPADLVQHAERVSPDVPAPYPCLVTAGHDEEGGHVLVDLEHIRALGIDGPPEHARQIITAAAVELACSPFADDVCVCVIGACQEIGDVLSTGRLQYVDDLDDLLDTLEAHARSDRDALRRLGGTAAARARTHAGEWAPEVLLVADPLTDRQRRRLADLVDADPQLAIAAITAGAEGLTDWVLRCADEPASKPWMLEPVGLDVEPQRITSADYTNIIEILRTVDRRPEAAQDTRPKAAQDTRPEAPQDTRPEAAQDTRPKAANYRPEAADVRPEAAEGTASPAPATPGVAGDGPVIKVLGPVTVERARGNVDKSHVGQLTEIAVYIALHPGAAGDDLDTAIWPGEPEKKASRAQACSRLRNWLGSDDDGERYFPQMADGRYRFAPAVRTDWELFQALVPADPATVATDQLEEALSLVTGQPFTGATGRRPKYGWADRLKSEMIIAVTDAAAVVAERALAAGRPAQARAAAATGLQAEPGMEQLWRLLLRAEHRAGNLEAVRTSVDRLERQLEDIGSDPEPETAELIVELARTSRRHLAV